jgi:Holliday junction resolvasome RuvABC DNA-binding subunit
MSERPQEPQLKDLQRHIDALIELGYDVSGLSNEDIEYMIEQVNEGFRDGDWEDYIEFIDDEQYEIPL